MDDNQTIDEWLAEAVGPDRIESAREQLAALIQEGFASDEGIEVNEKFWRELDRDLRALQSFTSGTTAELPDSRCLAALVKEAESESPIPADASYWNVVRDRLRKQRPPGIYR